MNVLPSKLVVNICCFVGGGLSTHFQTTGGIYGGKGYLKKYFGVKLFTETFVTPQCDFQGCLPLLQTTVLEAPPVARNCEGQ